MDLGAKTIEILAQLLTKSQIARYSNITKFLQTYGYPNHVTDLFSKRRKPWVVMMRPGGYRDWGADIIRYDFKQKGILTRGGFFVKLSIDFLNEIEDNVLGISYEQYLSEQDIERFHRHLELDGYKYENKMLVPIEYDSQETQKTKSVMESMIDRNPELSQGVLIKHLQDCEENYNIRHWKDSIAQARNFVEQLLEDIANASPQAKKEKPDLSKPVTVRDYLTKAGFFDEEEGKNLVNGVYGHLSEEGSHPGISDDKVARVSRSIIISFGYYILEKFESWKKTGFAKLP